MTTEYAYDEVGNLTTKTLGNRVDTYTYDSYNQLTSYKGYDGYQQRYTYNAQGHMTKRESSGNSNRQTLEEIVRGDEQKAATSDGEDSDDPDPYAGSASAENWQVTTYIYDVTAPYYEVLSETTDGVTTSYDYGIERLAAYSGGAWNASKTEYVYDGRGSVAQEITYNNSWYTFKGALAKKNITSKSYSPFGEMLTGKTSGFGYNGEYYDSATGMLNLRARQYEPAQMRFGQRDLIKGDAPIPLSLNRYLYCTNDPVNFADFDGLKKKSIWDSLKTAYNNAKKWVNDNIVQPVKKAVTAVKTWVNKTIVNPVKEIISNRSTKAASSGNDQTASTTPNGKSIYTGSKTFYYGAESNSQSNNNSTNTRSPSYPDGSLLGYYKDTALSVLDQAYAEWRLKNDDYSKTDVSAAYQNAMKSIEALYKTTDSVGTATIGNIIDGMELIMSQIADKKKKLSQYSSAELEKLQTRIATEGLSIDTIREICSEIVDTDKPVGAPDRYYELDSSGNATIEQSVWINSINTKTPYFKATGNSLTISVTISKNYSANIAKQAITLYDQNGKEVIPDLKLLNGKSEWVYTVEPNTLYYADIKPKADDVGHASLVYDRAVLVHSW